MRRPQKALHEGKTRMLQTTRPRDSVAALAQVQLGTAGAGLRTSMPVRTAQSHKGVNTQKQNLDSLWSAGQEESDDRAQRTADPHCPAAALVPRVPLFCLLKWEKNGAALTRGLWNPVVPRWPCEYPRAAFFSPLQPHVNLGSVQPPLKGIQAQKAIFT